MKLFLQHKNRLAQILSKNQGFSQEKQAETLYFKRLELDFENLIFT